MNEQLQQAVTNLIGKAIETADKAGAFIEAETPEFVNQLLMWHMVKGFVTVVICVAIISIFFFCFYTS